jgi:hypothetical protein
MVTAELRLAFAANVGRCKSPRCRAKIVWTLSERGKKVPLDHRPVDPKDHAPRELFAIRIDEETGELHSIGVPTAWLDEDDPVFTAHFATCPDRDRFRR